MENSKVVTIEQAREWYRKGGRCKDVALFLYDFNTLFPDNWFKSLKTQFKDIVKVGDFIMFKYSTLDDFHIRFVEDIEFEKSAIYLKARYINCDDGRIYFDRSLYVRITDIKDYVETYVKVTKEEVIDKLKELNKYRQKKLLENINTYKECVSLKEKNLEEMVKLDENFESCFEEEYNKIIKENL